MPVLRGATALCAWAVAGCGRISFDPASPAQTDGGIDAGLPRPPVFVQHAANGTAATLTKAMPFPAPVTAGDLILVAIDYDLSTPQVAGVSDSQGNTYTVLGPFDAPRSRQYLAYALAQTSDVDTVTATLDAIPAQFLELRIHEYADVSPTDPFDAVASAGGTATGPDAAASPLIVTTSPNELVFGLVIDGTVSAGTGFTLRSSEYGDVTEDRIAATPGSYAATATVTGIWNATVAAFRGR
jgi:hypothetical protein